MKAAIIRYTAIVAKGGWRSLPDMKLQPGSNHPAVGILRERLTMSGELRDGGSSESYDHSVEKAVRRYQETNGLAPTGIVDKTTAAALNVPAEARLKQLKTNLTRLQEYAKPPGKYIVVNIPAAQVEAVENNVVVSRHAGVVGKIDRQTPILKSAVHELNFNAVWTLPPTVIEKDLIPKGQEMAKRGESVLVKFKIDAYGGDGRKLDPTKVNWSGGAKSLTFRQQPGPENPLGFVKMNFHNAHSVYMHDTPGQSLFGRNFRAASSGCVRIHGIEKSGSMGGIRPGLAARARPADQGEPGAARRDPQAAYSAIFRLYHRLGHPGRRCAVPARHLPEGWGREQSRPPTERIGFGLPKRRSFCSAENESDTSPHATTQGLPVRTASSRICLNRRWDEPVGLRPPYRRGAARGG